MHEDDGRPVLEVRCRDFDAHGLEQRQQAELKERVMDVIVAILARIAVFPDIEGTLLKLFKEERVADRALSFTTSFVTKGNIFGSKPRDRITDWATVKDTEYELRRSEPWDKGIEGSVVPRKEPNEGVKADSSGPGDYEGVSHADVRTRSLIRESLWNEAAWAATGFSHFGDRDEPPLLMLLFRNKAPAERIFLRWLEELGTEDTDERLRISIIRKIDSKHPFAYTVIVGSNWPSPAEGAGLSIMVSRLNRMDPDTGENLARFQRLYQSAGAYDLTFGSIRSENNGIEPGSQRIRKRALFVRDAWEIGPNDPDCVGINPGLDPILPEGQSEAPVLQLLEKLRKGDKTRDAEHGPQPAAVASS